MVENQDKKEKMIIKSMFEQIQLVNGQPNCSPGQRKQ